MGAFIHFVIINLEIHCVVGQNRISWKIQTMSNIPINQTSPFFQYQPR
ncbi:hypothetical protein E1A91_D04G087700v1 [Gossypium mustelinum]|uniref:Uncharacterized protein n=1 Tax=Gossypium mustelinum TaxID=34275 RepID=A0A5D2VBR5_GOSMU|nr:hypothetical protein E1A91_D04G087700v1 [Gossypium mustelinum]